MLSINKRHVVGVTCFSKDMQSLHRYLWGSDLSKELIGIGAILLTVLLMAITDALIKVTMVNFSLWQLFLTRSPLVVLLLAMSAVFSREKLTSVLESLLDPWVNLRSLLIIIMYFFMYISLPYLNLAVMGAAVLISPICTALMSALLLKDKVGSKGWLGVALGFVGVLMISRPGRDIFQPAIILPIFAGLCYSMTALVTRSKLQKTSTIGVALSLNVLVFFVSATLVLGLTFNSVPKNWVEYIPFVLRPWVPMSSRDIAMIAVMAGLTCGITVLLALAYQVGRTVVIATLEYSYLVFAGLIGFFFLDEVLSIFSILGMAILVGSGILVLTRPTAIASQSKHA